MATKRLYRSRTDRIIAGVCGGLGNYFDIDPIFIRLLFIVFTLVGGSGILLYFLAWILIPEESLKDSHNETSKHPEKQGDMGETIESKAKLVAEDIRNSFKSHRHSRGQNLVAVLLIVFGVLFLAQNLFHIIIWDNLWPVLVIIVGIAIILRSGIKARS